MKNLRSFLVAIGVIIVCTPLYAVSLGDVKEDKKLLTDDPYFGGILNYGVSLAGVSFLPSNSEDLEGKNGWEAAFLLRYRSRYSVSVSYGTYDVGVKNSNTTIAGEGDVKPLLFNIQYAYPINSYLTPFVRGGGGPATVDIDSRSTTFYTLPIRQEIESGTMFVLGGGVNIFPLRNSNFSLEASYSRIFFNPSLKSYISFGPSEFLWEEASIDLGGDLFRLGATYFF